MPGRRLMLFRTFFAAALLLPLSFPLGAELLVSPAIRGSPQRLERIEHALEILEQYAPESPVLRWSRLPGDPRYEGDLWISLEELDESTLGQWNGAEIILGLYTMDTAGVQELALVLHHEAAHADHHYRDLEAVLINDYSSFFSPRQYLLFEMLNEAIAVYKETSLRYSMGLDGESRKYQERPTLVRYDEDFYAFYKDLRRWLKSRNARLSPQEFEQLLYRKFVTGFFVDPWYLDYYMPHLEQRYIILRGKDFAVCPMVCSADFSRFNGKEGTRAVINRYIEKNSPKGLELGMDAAELENVLEYALQGFEGEGPGDGPGEWRTPRNLETYRLSQSNYEELLERFRQLPAGLELRYTFSFAPETVKAFHRLLDDLK